MEVSESKITELVFLYVEDNATIFFDKGLCCLVCFLRKLWVWEKIHLKFVKPWEIKNLPWDREKGSETTWHTVQPWELRGLSGCGTGKIKVSRISCFVLGNNVRICVNL